MGREPDPAETETSYDDQLPVADIPEVENSGITTTEAQAIVIEQGGVPGG